tara:strand:- start:264 stop:401 length:138 start_codon:yes stop_codon:yes gene_type:complete
VCLEEEEQQQIMYQQVVVELEELVMLIPLVQVLFLEMVELVFYQV